METLVKLQRSAPPLLSLKGLLLLCFLLFTAFAYGQQEARQRISLEVQELPLRVVLETISQQAGVTFSYSKKRIPVDTLVSLSVRDKSLQEVLNLLLEEYNIRYTFVEKQIVLQTATDEKPAPTAAAQTPQKKHTLSGYVRDKASGEILIGATILVQELAAGAVSNAYGYFSMSLPEGAYSLKVSYTGFAPQELTLLLQRSQQLDFSLQPATAYLEEVVVDSRLNLGVVEYAQAQRSHVPLEDVSSRPALLGEEEVLKALQSSPGVKAHSDGSTQFHVRGGERDQNLILLDDAPIYNPSHMLGIFSSIIPEALKDVQFYKSAIPARLGGSLSSVLDMKGREGNLKRFGFSGHVGLSTLRLGVEGPVVKDKSAYFLSLRSSLLKKYVQRANPGITDFGFSDLNAKVNWQPNAGNRFYWSFYSGNDQYVENNHSGISWQNLASSLRWNHVFNHKLFANTTLYTSQYDYSLITSLEQNNAWKSQIANLSLKSDFSWFPNLNNTVSFGLEIRGHSFNPGNFELGSGGRPAGIPQIAKRFARETVLYVGNEQRIHPRLSLQYGLRLTSWTNVGESFEYRFDAAGQPVDSLYFGEGKVYNRYFRPAPRLSLTYELSKQSTLQLSLGRTVQNTHLISSSISPFTNLEVWLPSGPNIRPQTANQLELAYFRFYREKGISLGAAGYYKRMQNQLDYKPHAQLLLNPYLEGELRFGSARAYGSEFYVKKESGRLQGQLSYSYARVFKEINGLNNNLPYPARHDRPHAFDAYASYRFSPRFQLAANWLWSSGSALTMPTGFYHYKGYQLPVYASLNNERMPAYHRLDLSAHWQLNKKSSGFQHSLRFSLYNVYMRKNPIYLNTNKIRTAEGGLLVPADLSEPLQGTPSFTYLYRLVPSLTYHFSL